MFNKADKTGKNKKKQNMENEEPKQNRAAEEARQNEQPEEDQEAPVDQQESVDELQQMQERYNELYDKYLRLMSEFENYRKRTSQEKDLLIKTASESMIVDLLPVFDDLERAMEAYGDKPGELEGFRLIYDKFKKVLTSKGLEEIQAKGEVFDSEYHEAISQMQAPSKKLKGCVIEQVEKGYTLNGKIIRHAKVIVGA